MYIPKNAFYNPNFNPYKVNCEQQVCPELDAYVNCIGNILQGRNGCIVIQLIDENGLPLDLKRIKYIKVVITNALGYYVGTWSKKSISIVKDDDESGSGEDTSTGKIRLILNPNQTNTVTGPLTAQILIVTDEEMCNEHIINCIVLANIVRNAAKDICPIDPGSGSGGGEDPDEDWCCDRDRWVVWDDED